MERLSPFPKSFEECGRFEAAALLFFIVAGYLSFYGRDQFAKTSALVALVAGAVFYIWERTRHFIVPADMIVFTPTDHYCPGEVFLPKPGYRYEKLRVDHDVITATLPDPAVKGASKTRSASIVWEPNRADLHTYIERGMDRKKLLDSFRKLLEMHIDAEPKAIEDVFYEYARHYGITFERVDVTAPNNPDPTIEDTLSKFEKRIGLSARGRSIANITREFEQFEKEHAEQMKQPAFANRIKNMRQRFIADVMDAN